MVHVSWDRSLARLVLTTAFQPPSYDKSQKYYDEVQLVGDAMHALLRSPKVLVLEKLFRQLDQLELDRSDRV